MEISQRNQPGPTNAKEKKNVQTMLITIMRNQSTLNVEWYKMFSFLRLTALSKMNDMSGSIDILSDPIETH